MRKEVRSGTEKRLHLLVGLHSNLKPKDKDLILKLRRKSMKK